MGSQVKGALAGAGAVASIWLLTHFMSASHPTTANSVAAQFTMTNDVTAPPPPVDAIANFEAAARRLKKEVPDAVVEESEYELPVGKEIPGPVGHDWVPMTRWGVRYTTPK